MKILVTGGAGSIGSWWIEYLLKSNTLHNIVVFDNDENGLFYLKRSFKDKTSLSFVLGDIRDFRRIKEVMYDVDVVYHFAALKHLPTGEEYILEVLKTNVFGTNNVLQAAIECYVPKIFLISTDKVVYPENLYGMSKLFAETLVLKSSSKHTKASILRLCNVWGTRGSVSEIWEEQYSKGQKLTVTHKDMYRYFIEKVDAIDFIASATKYAEGGDIFVPSQVEEKSIFEMAKTYVGGDLSRIEITSHYPGETLTHNLMTEEEEKKAKRKYNMWIIK